MNNIKTFLKSLPLFYGADEKTIDCITDSDVTQILKFNKNDVVYEKNSKNNFLIIVLSGQVVVKKAEVVIKYLNKGDIFGVSTLFTENDGFCTTVIADKPAQLMMLPQKLVTELMQSDFTLTKRYIEFLSNRIQYLNNVIDRYTGANATAKLANYLLNRANSQGNVFNVSMSGIALNLNLGRASVYRAAEELCDLNIIQKQGKTIRILNAAHLEEYIK